LARCLAVAVDDETTRSRLIAAGRTRRQDFSWNRTVDQLLALYGRMIR
jgi:glycosyltransferase involved in cell wall biosynthesis